MLDKASLDKMQELVLAGAGVSYPTIVPLQILPKDMSIQSLEQHLAGRCRYRGTFVTQLINDIALYASKFEGGKCFIDAQRMAAMLFLNLGEAGSPGHGDHQAVLKLTRTAPFTNFLTVLGDKHGQKELAEWLEDWAAYTIAYTSEGESLEIKKAVASIRRMTISQKSDVTSDQSNFRGERSAMEQIEARSEQALPAGFRFSCIPYHGLDERSFEARLSVITSDPPRLLLRAIRMEEANENMANEFSEKLRTALKSAGADSDVYIGAFAP